MSRLTSNDQEVLYSAGRQDEAYTPRYGVLPIIKYLPKGKIIWCPFDTSSSEYVTALQEQDFKVVYSHISTGQDFYFYEPKKWDIIVSNPPYTRKRNIFERCISFNKPFALLMTNTWLNDSAPKQLFKSIDLQLLMFDKRIIFGEDKVTFSTSYYCRDILPKQIIMEELNVIKGQKSRTCTY